MDCATYFARLGVQAIVGGYPIWQFARNTLTLRQQTAAVAGPANPSVCFRLVFVEYPTALSAPLFLLNYCAPRAAPYPQFADLGNATLRPRRFWATDGFCAPCGPPRAVSPLASQADVSPLFPLCTLLTS